MRQADALNSLVVSEAQFVLEGQNAALLHYKHRFTELLQEVMKLLRGELQTSIGDDRFSDLAVGQPVPMSQSIENASTHSTVLKMSNLRHRPRGAQCGLVEVDAQKFQHRLDMLHSCEGFATLHQGLHTTLDLFEFTAQATVQADQSPCGLASRYGERACP